MKSGEAKKKLKLFAAQLAEERIRMSEMLTANLITHVNLSKSKDNIDKLFAEVAELLQELQDWTDA